jgi:hypothetical protein
LKVPADTLRADFQAKMQDAPKATKGAAVKEDAKPKLLKVLDPKKSQNLAIALRPFPPPEMLDTYLRSMSLDRNTLNEEQMLLLRAELPSGELIDSMAQQESDFPDVPWDMPEKYLRTLGRIPHVEHRLTVWAFLISYKDHAESVSAKLTNFEKACVALLESEALQLFFGVCVAVGNVINEGTTREKADGVSIDSIRKMADLKSDGKGHTLLSYAAGCFVACGGSVDELLEDVESELEQATGSWEDVDKIVSKLVSDANTARSLYEQLLSGGEDLSHVADKMSRTEMGATQLKERCTACHELYKNALQYFCVKGDAYNQPTEQFFQEWRSLLALVRLASSSAPEVTCTKTDRAEE